MRRSRSRRSQPLSESRSASRRRGAAPLRDAEPPERGPLGQQRGHGGDAGQPLARLGGAGPADQRHEVGGAGERPRLGLGGVQAGQAGLEQRAERGDVAVDGAGGRGHGAQADQAVGAQDDVVGGQAADGQADAVRLGDALGQPPQHRADLALGHRAVGEPLGERLAVDPLVDDVGGAAGGLRVAGCPRRRRRPSPGRGWPGRRR